MHRGPRSRGWAGGLLIMLLLGVGLMLFLSFGGAGVSGSAQVALEAKQSSEVAVNEITVAQLVQAIVTYELANGKPPTSISDLDGAASGAFQDPWGGDLSFQIERAGRARNVIVRSVGPDGEADTEDDIQIEQRMPV